ncbi:MAG TPA: EcsC family protein [Ktedonobacterales bacterium]
MTADEQQDDYLNPLGGSMGKAFSAVPPEVQSLFNQKPGRTSERIHQVITWAAAVDPEVLRQHQRHSKHIQTVADIQQAPLRERDRVAQHFAQQYRHRAALTGAVTALPGGLWALVGMGADVQLTAIYAVRMAAKVAQSYGYDTSTVEEQVRLADVLALAAGIDSLRGIGNWLTREGLVQLLPELLPRVLGRLSVELTAEQAAKWIGRIVPGVSAVVGGAVDYAFLRAAGERAIAYYHNRALADRGELPPGAERPALPAPSTTASETSSSQSSEATARIVDADPIIVAPSLADSVEPSASVAPAVAAIAQPTPALTPSAPITPAKPAKPATPARERRQRRAWAVYLPIFVVLVLASSAVACVALASLASSALHFAH